jgi:hypothetical protein
VTSDERTNLQQTFCREFLAANSSTGYLDISVDWCCGAIPLVKRWPSESGQWFWQHYTESRKQVQRVAIMNDKNMLKQQTTDRLNLTYEVSDEVLERAAMVNGTIKNYTLAFCSTPWTCPMSPQRE